MKLLFIVGTGRCGSSLVHEILSKHEAFGFVSNIEDNFPLLNRLGRWNNAIYRSPVGSFTKKGGLRFAPSEAYELMSREISPIYANSCRDLGAADVTPWLEKKFRRFFESRNLAQGKPVFSHKYTGWSRLGFFARIFPEAQFLHIVRDGRAVANSWLQMPWWGGYRGPDNWLWGPLSTDMEREWRNADCSFATLAAIGWKVLMESFHRAETCLEPGRYMLMRYEDILLSPRDSFESIMEFIGVRWSRAFEKHFIRQKFFSERNRAFEDDLSPIQVSEIEQSLQSYLLRYKYE